MNTKYSDEELTKELAGVIERVLVDLGDNIKGLSWFSSVADEYNSERVQSTPGPEQRLWTNSQGNGVTARD